MRHQVLFCHRFARWRITLFHIITIGGLLVPQFWTCINTNYSLEEDLLFGLGQPVMIAEGREPFRSGYLFLGVMERVVGEASRGIFRTMLCIL